MKLKYLVGRALIIVGDVLEQLQCLSRKILPKLLIFGLGFVLAYFICTEAYHRELNEQQDVRDFVDKIISSVLDQTEFYKKHSQKQAIETIEEYANDFSKCYKVGTFDKTFHAYEAVIIFDNEKRFYVDVIVRKDNIELFQFRYID